MKATLLAFMMSLTLSSAYAAGDDINVLVCGGIPAQIEFIVKNESALLRFYNTETGKLVVSKLTEDVIESGHLTGQLRDEVYEFAAMEYGATASLMYKISTGNKKTKKINNTYILLDTDLGTYLLMSDKDGLSTLGSKKECERAPSDPRYIRKELS
nr:hypothetical protein BHI3_20050 [Bacteriovorax sp. HI3]